MSTKKFSDLPAHPVACLAVASRWLSATGGLPGAGCFSPVESSEGRLGADLEALGS